MLGLCAARRDLAGDQKGPFHKHVRGKAQKRSRVGGVTTLLPTVALVRQQQVRMPTCVEFDCVVCVFQIEMLKHFMSRYTAAHNGFFLLKSPLFLV